MKFSRPKKWWLDRIGKEPPVPIAAGAQMVDHGGNFAMEYQPTLAERFWRKIGFQYHLGNEPEDVDAMLGWQCTVTRLELSFLDRLRLLTTGRIILKTVQHTDTPSPEVIKTRFDWHILPPGQKR